MYHGGCHTIQGLVSAHVRTRAYLRTTYSFLLRQIDTSTSIQEFGKFEGVGRAQLAEILDDVNAMLPIEGTDIKTAAATARALTTAVHNAQGDQVIALLAVETEEGHYGSQLAYYRSMKGAKETARFFTSSIARPNLDAYFPAPVFIEAMRARVLAPMRDASGGLARLGCTACGVNAVVLRQGARPKQPLHAYHWMHAASCPRCMGQLDEGRHNQLCKLLAAFLKRCRLADGTPVATSVTLETECLRGAERQQVPFSPSDPSRTYTAPDVTLMDIVMRCPTGRVAFIDVAVADPGCVTYMNRASDSSVYSSDAAARSREADKRSRFDRALARATSVVEVGCTQENFVPFVFEASGRLGPSARHFLESLNHANPDDVRRFTEQAAIICARDLGRAILQSRGVIVVRSSSRSK